jgi:hypothetical protein
MEPLLPEDREGRLAEVGVEVIRCAERLRGGVHPITRRGVAELVRSVNSYYSILIEGHRMMPRDIDAAQRQEFFGDAQRRGLHLLHWAHVETRRWIEAALTVTRELIGHGLLLSGSPEGPLRPGFPSAASASYFPNLYPAGSE